MFIGNSDHSLDGLATAVQTHMNIFLSVRVGLAVPGVEEEKVHVRQDD